MAAQWLSCGDAVPATASHWDWGTFPQWLSAVGTIAATITALWIASRQRAAEERVLAGTRREMAAHIGIEDPGDEGVVVRNFGLTPVTRVTAKAEAHLDEDGGPDVGWLNVDLVTASADPRRKDLLPASETVRFAFDWGGPPTDPTLRRQAPYVTIEYTDAAGTRWRRRNLDLPVRVGGQPLPGSARETRQAKRRSRRRWVRQRRRNVWRSLRLGFRGKRFTKKGRQKWRDKQHEKQAEAQQTRQD